MPERRKNAGQKTSLHHGDLSLPYTLCEIMAGRRRASDRTPLLSQMSAGSAGANSLNLDEDKELHVVGSADRGLGTFQFFRKMCVHTCARNTAVFSEW